MKADLLVLSLLVVAAGCRDARPLLDGPLVVLHDVTVIDGLGGPPRPGQAVVLRGDRIPWVIPGVSFHEEMLLLHDAGLPAAAVLRMATSGGAAALGLDAERGTVEAGQRADLVVLSADPLGDLHNTRAIEWVIAGGRRYRPSELLATPPTSTPAER